MDRLTIEYAGQYVPKKICTVNRFGEADDCASCEEECENDCENCAIQECFNALGVYENLEVTPEQIREIDKLYAEKCEELTEYQKAQLELSQLIADIKKDFSKDDTYSASLVLELLESVRIGGKNE